MAFPLFKLLSVSYRYASRPINNIVVRTIKARNNHSQEKSIFVPFGHFMHRIEI